MKKLYLLLVLVTFSLITKSQTLDICGSLPPAGWVTTAIKGYCAKEGFTNYIGRTITRVDNLPPGTVLNICGEMPPAGWITTSVNGYCAKIGFTNYIGRTIKKIEGLPPGTTLNVCGEMPPAGWITTSVNGYCAKIEFTNYIGRTIKKIEGLPIGTVLNICGDNTPPEWIRTGVTGQCAKIEFTTYTGSTIQKISGVVGQTITFNPLPVVAYGSADVTPVVSASSGLPVSLSSSNPAVAGIVNGRIRIYGAGTAYITASQGGNPAYNPAPNVSQLLTVNKAGQSISFPEIAKKSPMTADFDPGATASSNLPVTYNSGNTQVATIVAGKIHITGIGTSIIEARQAGNENYNPAGYFARVLTVGKEEQTITFAPLPTKVTGAADFAAGAKASSGLAVSYTSSNTAVATISGQKIKVVGIGTSTITASQPGNAAYNAAANVSQTLTVKSPQTITFKPMAAKDMGAADFTPAATASSGLPVSFASSNANVATIVNGKIHITGVGITSIVASQAGNGSFAAAATVSQPFTVNKGGQTITFKPIREKIMTAADFAPGATASSKLPVSYTSSNKSVATIVDGKIHLLKAGTSTITASQPGNASFGAAANVTQLLTVSKAKQTITFKAITTKLIGVADFDPGAKASSGLAVTYKSSNTAVATIVNGKIHLVKTGTAIITASQTGNTIYDAASPVSQTLTAEKAAQAITFKAIPEKLMGTPDFDPGATASSGLKITYTSSNTEVAKIVGGKIRILKMGVTNITASQAGNANFNAATSVSRILTVKKNKQTITFNAIPAKTVGAPDFDPGATASSGLPVTYKSSTTVVATILNGKVHIIKDGSTIITASQAGNDFYEPATIVTQKLTIKKPNAVPAMTEPTTSEEPPVSEATTEDPDQEIVETDNLKTVEKPADLIRKPTEFKYNIYPNPASGQIHIETGDGEDAGGRKVWIQIYNVRGVLEKAIETSVGGKVTLPVDQLREGMYLIRVTNGKNEVTKQVMIKH